MSNKVEDQAAADKAITDKAAADKVISDKAIADKAAADKKPKEKGLKIKFKISPTGKFNLAYSVGETAVFNKPQADELIEAGYAELVK